MAQTSLYELLDRVLKRECPVGDYLLAGVDRQTGQFLQDEGPNLDFKVHLNPNEQRSVAEIARDVLAFSNTSGGLVIFGINDQRHVMGHPPIDCKNLRSALGPYLGTRLDFELGNVRPSVQGRSHEVSYLLVAKSSAAYPALLRKDIVSGDRFGTKLKYLKGSLFYREGRETRVEPTGGDIDGRALELQFTGASPRVRSSFILEEDRPGVRLYSHINDRFFGREDEISQLLAKFDDTRGRGISIAGLGGIGKTELAIEIVRRLFQSGKFRSVYSGSAKTAMLGKFGHQPIDPFFFDLPSFLQDLGGWLGIDIHASNALSESEDECLRALKSLRKTLLFIDNLETVDDGRLFQFLDQKIPDNIWLLTTSRVHKVKNWIYLKQLDSLEKRDAAKLLRHELQRQGLSEYASEGISDLEKKAESLRQHPLTIRWFAWACHREPDLWNKGPGIIPKQELDNFCVGQTLKHLEPAAKRVLGAIATSEGQTTITTECIQAVSRVSGAALDSALYELECAGLISVAVDEQTGLITYSVMGMASEPSRHMSRRERWEQEFVRGLNEFLQKDRGSQPPDPLIRSLLDFNPARLMTMNHEEIRELERRVERANSRPHSYRLHLQALAAECERHLGNTITSDDLYRSVADEIIQSGQATEERNQRILLEAATVAKTRSQAPQQLDRAIHYLQAIEKEHLHPLRVLGTLVELSALKGDRAGYGKFRERVVRLRDKERSRFSESQINSLDEALRRAETIMDQGR